VIFDRWCTEHETHQDIDPTISEEFHFLCEYVHLDSTLDSFALDILANPEHRKVYIARRCAHR
jgi:hypothetical protein